MNKKALLSSTVISAALFLGAATPASANAIPDFGSCLNPQWTKTQDNILHDVNGPRHGVIGIGSYLGQDTIYESNGNVLQCLCTDTGKGYQTNWLKADSLSSEQVKELKAKGWMYVPYGQDWGLQESAYLAKNSEYECEECTPTPTPTVEVTPSVTVTPTTEVTNTPAPTNEEKKEESKSEESTPIIGGLASTGNAFVIYASLLAGAAAVITGMVLRKLSK